MLFSSCSILHGGGPWPFLSLSPTSFTAPHYHVAACSSSRVNIRRLDVSGGGSGYLFTSVCAVCNSLLAIKVIWVRQAVTWGAFVVSSEAPRGTPHAQFSNMAKEPSEWTFVTPFWHCLLLAWLPGWPHSNRLPSRQETSNKISTFPNVAWLKENIHIFAKSWKLSLPLLTLLSLPNISMGCASNFPATKFSLWEAGTCL